MKTQFRPNPAANHLKVKGFQDTQVEPYARRRIR